MEFGTGLAPQGSPDIDDATRLAASARVNTVTPTHASIAPDDLSDDRIVSEHIIAPAVANAANDTEFTPGDTAENIASQKVHHVAIIASVSASLIIAAFLILAVMFMA